MKKIIPQLIRLATLPPWYVKIELRRLRRKFVASLTSVPHIIVKGVALKICSLVGLDRWYATKILGWSFDYTVDPKNPRDYHFYSRRGYPIYPRDYGFKNLS